jgi:hypothetical protein
MRSYSHNLPVPVQLGEHGEPRGQLGREERDGLTWRYVPSGEGTRFGALYVVVDVSCQSYMHGAGAAYRRHCPDSGPTSR